MHDGTPPAVEGRLRVRRRLWFFRLRICDGRADQKRQQNSDCNGSLFHGESSMIMIAMSAYAPLCKVCFANRQRLRPIGFQATCGTAESRALQRRPLPPTSYGFGASSGFTSLTGSTRPARRVPSATVTSIIRPTGFPFFTGNTLMVTWSPTFSDLSFQPLRISVEGFSLSTVQDRKS